jgi:hypothetical protein
VGIRFRKAIKLLPGVRLNLSLSGVSVTIGPRGANINIGPRGTFLNTGIPGTGLYSRERLFKPQRNVQKNLVTLSGLDVADSLPESVLDQSVNRYTELVQAIERVHWTTRSPKTPPTYSTRPFEQSPPEPPALRSVAVLDRLFGRREQIESDNKALRTAYEHVHREWLREKEKHELDELARRNRYEKGIFTSPVDALHVMQEELQQDQWVFPFTADVKLDDAFAWAYVYIDLPEIDTFPTTRPEIKRGKLAWRPLEEYEQRHLYAQYVHGLVFKVIGAAFSCLQRVPLVIVAAYTQRPLLTPTSRYDAYVISVRVSREQWSFNNVRAVNPISDLMKFDLRRDLADDIALRVITPHDKPKASR